MNHNWHNTKFLQLTEISRSGKSHHLQGAKVSDPKIFWFLTVFEKLKTLQSLFRWADNDYDKAKNVMNVYCTDADKK